MKTTTLIARATAALTFALMALVSTAVVQAQDFDDPNMCEEAAWGGEPEACSSDSDCRTFEVCITDEVNEDGDATCQLNCEDDAGQTDAALCGFGESCVASSDSSLYCKPSTFRMDLNLLDLCIKHWLDGTSPTLASNTRNFCSLESSLDQLLNQDDDNDFDIADVDQCILAFLEQPGCVRCDDAGLPGCRSVGGISLHCQAPDLTPCVQDTDCGRGLYCDTNRNACTRDCGVIPYAREAAVYGLERECTGALKTCDRSRGRCEPIPPESLGDCEVDRDCLSGAYCLLGQCAPFCNRSVDCPYSRWACGADHKCRAAPGGQSDAEGFTFDPLNFAVRFTQADVQMNPIENQVDLELIVMDLTTRRQVVDNPSVNFGYRLTTHYNIKSDVACLQAVQIDCTDPTQRNNQTYQQCQAIKSDCIVEPDEEWLQPLNPFGVISGRERPTLQFALNANADALSPGLYTVDVTAYFDNGDSHSTRVTLTIPSPSGEYKGTLSMFLETQSSPLTNIAEPFVVEMDIKVEDETVIWDELLAEHNITQDGRIYHDLLEGKLVRANLNGDISPPFTRTGAGLDGADNEVPLVGLYDEDSGLMRLIGAIIVPVDFALCEDAAVDSVCPTLEVQNHFGRTITRIFEWYGPYDPLLQGWAGTYREKIVGLGADGSDRPTINVSGRFLLRQSRQDDSPILWGGAANNNCMRPEADDGIGVCPLSERDNGACRSGSSRVCACNIPGKEALICDTGPCTIQDWMNGMANNTTIATCNPDLDAPGKCLTPDADPDIDSVCFCDMPGQYVLLCDDGHCSTGDARSLLGSGVGEWASFDTFAECVPQSSVTLMPNDEPAAPFPNDWATVLDQRIADTCEGEDLEAAAALFTSEGRFDTYLTETLGDASSFPVVPDLTRFELLVEEAITAIADDPTLMNSGRLDDVRTELNLYEFLHPWVQVCPQRCDISNSDPYHGCQPDEQCINSRCIDDAAVADLDINEFTHDDVVCVEERKARCGLYLNQKAILNHWINVEQVDGCLSAGDCIPTADWPLFCRDSLEIEGCLVPGDEGLDVHKAVFTLQEHNRFWLNHVQSTKFEGDKLLSDAFVTLFRHQINPFQQGVALSYKLGKLRGAVKVYNELLELIMGPVESQVQYGWPMRGFQQIGNDWLAIVQTLLADRLEALTELADLKRRVANNTERRDVLFAQHTLQMEYLTQVYLMALQREWQGEVFGYLGDSGEQFSRGRELTRILNPAKNALGVTPNKVYFENNDPDSTNWRFYHDRLTVQIDDTRETIDGAVAELQSSLEDLDSFERSLLDARLDMERTLIDSCGFSTLFPNPTGDLNGDGLVDNQDIVPDLNRNGEADYCDYLLDSYANPRKSLWIAYCKFQNYFDGDIECAAPGTAGLGLGAALAGGIISDLLCSSGLFETGGGATENWIAQNSDALQDEFGSCDNLPDGFAFSCGKFDGPFAAPQSQFPGASSLIVTDQYNCTSIIQEIASSPGGLGSQLPENCLENPDECGDPLNPEATCALVNEDAKSAVTLNINGVDQACIGGQMGDLLQEKASLELNRDQLVGDIETLIKNLNKKRERFFAANSASVINYYRSLVVAAIATVQAAASEFADGGFEAGEDIIAAIGCVFIAGFSIGTDCPQKIGSGIGTAALEFAGAAVRAILAGLKEAWEQAESIFDEIREDFNDDGGLNDQIVELYGDARELDGILTEFRVVNQDILNVGVQIEDLKGGIRQTARLYQTEVSFLADHLVGRETGNVINGRKLSRDADAELRKVRLTAFKMLRAFVHQYNIPKGEATVLENQLMATITLEEIEDFVSSIEDFEADYCGRASIDCDTFNNTEVLRVSLRQLLFPNLRDIVDGRTGKVLTAGQQFHNTITSQPWVRRRIRSQRSVDQIEIPFSLLLTELENSAPGRPDWTIDPLSCDHRLDNPNNCTGVCADGTVALNVVGQNLGDPEDSERSINYQLVRGAVDYMRSCTPDLQFGEIGSTPTVGFPINTFTVGYAPQSNEEQSSSPPSFVTHSSAMGACINAPDQYGELGPTERCWRHFARGRSLSALDWKVQIPLRVDGGSVDTTWVLGDGIRNPSEKPVIEDLVLYFRYVSRPTVE